MRRWLSSSRAVSNLLAGELVAGLAVSHVRMLDDLLGLAAGSSLFAQDVEHHFGDRSG